MELGEVLVKQNCEPTYDFLNAMIIRDDSGADAYAMKGNWAIFHIISRMLSSLAIGVIILVLLQP